jgi:hypothetical protein
MVQVRLHIGCTQPIQQSLGDPFDNWNKDRLRSS